MYCFFVNFILFQEFLYVFHVSIGLQFFTLEVYFVLYILYLWYQKYMWMTCIHELCLRMNWFYLYLYVTKISTLQVFYVYNCLVICIYLHCFYVLSYLYRVILFLFVVNLLLFSVMYLFYILLASLLCINILRVFHI